MMALGERVDVLRAVQQPSYAARFSTEEWLELVRDPLWGELVGEMPEIVAPLIARYGASMPGYARVQLQANRNDPEAPQTGGGGGTGAAGGPSVALDTSEFAVLGKKQPPIQRLRVVT